MEAYEKLTLELLTHAFPSGLVGDEYFATMAILSDHMSMRNLTDVLAMFTKMDHATIANDVYGADTRVLSPELLEKVTRRLEESGLERWIQKVNQF